MTSKEKDESGPGKETDKAVEPLEHACGVEGGNSRYFCRLGLTRQGKRIQVRLGPYTEKREAARARDLMVIALGLERFTLNFEESSYTEPEIRSMLDTLQEKKPALFDPDFLQRSSETVEQNATPQKKNKTAKYRGVCKHGREYEAYVKYLGAVIKVGKYLDEKAAARARDLALLALNSRPDQKPTKLVLNFSSSEYSKDDIEGVKSLLFRKYKIRW